MPLSRSRKSSRSKDSKKKKRTKNPLKRKSVSKYGSKQKIFRASERLFGLLKRRLLLTGIVLWVVSALFLTLLIYKEKAEYKKQHHEPSSKIQYERPQPLGIESKIQDIDIIIYHSLLNAGMYSENIQYKAEKRTAKNGTSWEFCEMIIPVRDSQKVKRLKKKLEKKLKSAVPNVWISERKAKAKKEICTIFINRLPTHRLIFSPVTPTARSLQKEKNKTFCQDRKYSEIAIIIDDFGDVYYQAKEFLNIRAPITFSVLPFRRHSVEIAELAYKKGHEVMLHMPMEPYGYPAINPGKGALLLSMSDGEILTRTKECINQLSPYISGTNNHMGSVFTENRKKMMIVLEELKRRNLFFLDSLTSPHSVAYQIACSLHLPTAKRDIFLDVKQTREFINGQLRKLVSISKRTGMAIAIGHPYEITYKTLKDKLPELNGTQVRIVPASKIINELDQR